MACALLRASRDSSPCELGSTFGCEAGGTIWVAHDCRGRFFCGIYTLSCGYTHDGSKHHRVRCPCAPAASPNASRPIPDGTEYRGLTLSAVAAAPIYASGRFNLTSLPWSASAAPRDSRVWRLGGLPRFPCGSWRAKLAQLFVLRFKESRDAACRTLAVQQRACYVQVLKTGTSAVKTMFRLPIVGFSPWARGVPRSCALSLVTWREPIARFVSGISTIHARSRPWCQSLRALERSPELCTRIHTLGGWVAYARAVLDALEHDALRPCVPLPLAGPQNLAPELLHVLPQWAFLALLPSGSAVHLREVGDVAPTCVSRVPDIANNPAEGGRAVLRVTEADLRAHEARGGRALLARLHVFYAVDADIWRLLQNRPKRVAEGWKVVLA